MESHLGRRCRRIPPREVAEPPIELPLQLLNAVVYRWTSCVHRQDNGDYRDESRLNVRPFKSPSSRGVTQLKNVNSGLIVNFEFDPAYEGQTAKPSAAITMSMTGHVYFTIPV